MQSTLQYIIKFRVHSSGMKVQHLVSVVLSPLLAEFALHVGQLLLFLLDLLT